MVAHPDMEGPGEVVKVGLDEAEVGQAQLPAAHPGLVQGLLLVLDEDHL